MELVGRQWEQAGVDRFLDRLALGPAALLLAGEPGIGKTTVWRAAVEAARSRSYRVLTCRATEAEHALSFLGLGDLLERVSDEALEALPEPQRRALRSALLRSGDAGSPDRVSVARGALGVLRSLAAEAPTVVAIDDAQWLDAPSADACRFVVHRLAEERVGFLVSRGVSGLTLANSYHRVSEPLFRVDLTGPLRRGRRKRGADDADAQSVREDPEVAGTIRQEAASQKRHMARARHSTGLLRRRLGDRHPSKGPLAARRHRASRCKARSRRAYVASLSQLAVAEQDRVAGTEEAERRASAAREARRHPSTSPCTASSGQVGSVRRNWSRRVLALREDA